MDALRRHLLRHAALGAMAVGVTGAAQGLPALAGMSGMPGRTGRPAAAGSRATQVLVAGTSFARLFEPGADGRPRGLAVDLLDAILMPAGHHPRYEFYPWLRAQAMIEHGPAQILVGPYRTPERERLMRFSRQAFYDDALVFYARRREEGLWWGDFQALQPLRIGAVQGWVYGERFEQARLGLNVTAVRDLATALRMLQLDRLDLIAANQRNSEPVIQDLGLTDQVARCTPPFAQLRGHFAFSRDPAGEPWATLVDAGMQRLRASGELQQLAVRRGVVLPD